MLLWDTLILNLELGSCKRGTGLRVVCPQVSVPCAANLLPPTTLPMWISSSNTQAWGPRQSSALWIFIELLISSTSCCLNSVTAMGTMRSDSSQCPSSVPQMGTPWLPCFSILPQQKHQASSLPASRWQQCWDHILTTQADVPVEIRSAQEQLLVGTAVPVLWGREKTD